MEDNVTTVTQEAPETVNPPTQENPDPVAKRHAEQLAGSKAEVDKYRAIAIDSLAKQAQSDANVFIEAHSKDPKLANEIAKQLGYANADEVLATINKTVTKEPRGFTEDDIERIVSEREAKKEHERAIAKAEKLINKLPDDLKEEAQKRFEKITKGQMLDEETAIEFAEMATLYVNKENIRAGVYNESIAMLASTGAGSSKKNTNTTPQYKVDIYTGELIQIS